MLSGLASSLSGLAAAQTKLATSAHNVANANTDGFKKHRVVLEEGSQGGVRATIDVPGNFGSGGLQGEHFRSQVPLNCPMSTLAK